MAGLLLLAVAAGDEAPRERIERALGAATVETLLAQRHLRISPVCGGDVDAARHLVRDALLRLDARRGGDRERREALEDFEEGGDETTIWRLAEAARRHDRVRRPGDAEAGAAVEASNRAYYDSLLDTEAGKRRTEK